MALPCWQFKKVYATAFEHYLHFTVQCDAATSLSDLDCQTRPTEFLGGSIKPPKLDPSLIKFLLISISSNQRRFHRSRLLPTRQQRQDPNLRAANMVHASNSLIALLGLFALFSHPVIAVQPLSGFSSADLTFFG